MDEVAAFLRAQPPFDALSETELARLAAAAEAVAFAAGETIFAQGSDPQTSGWIVRPGGVELVDHGRGLDPPGPREPFGSASQGPGLPPGFAAPAPGATVAYRLPGDVTRPLLARPEGLRHVARTMLARPVAGVPRTAGGPEPERSVGALLRGPAGRRAAGPPVPAPARRVARAGPTGAGGAPPRRPLRGPPPRG